jgi:3,4-dihydroxy 2-butanone 4-phosphate synthase/GTP cyclohydrolase II
MKNALTDAFGLKDIKSWPLKDALKQISESPQGVIVMLNWPDEDAAILQWISDHSDHDKPETVKTKQPADIRTDGVGAQILVDLKVKKMKLMTAPKVIHGLAGFGLEVVDYVSGDDS